MPATEALPSTTGTVFYTKDAPHDLYSYVYKKEPGVKPEDQKEEFSNLERLETEVQVVDVRPVADNLSLEKNGFILRKLHVPSSIDWTNKEEVLHCPSLIWLQLWLCQTAKLSCRLKVFNQMCVNASQACSSTKVRKC